jgi:hypothetical protein
MNIEAIIKNKYPNCVVQRQGSLIFVTIGSNTTHHDVNYLEYLSSINELGKYLEETILKNTK